MEYKNIIVKAWEDPDFKKQLLKDPKKILVQEGCKIPEDMKVFVHENTEKEFHFTLPKKPEGELSDEELEALTGGILPILAIAFGLMFDAPGRTKGTKAEQSIGGPYPGP